MKASARAFRCGGGVAPREAIRRAAAANEGLLVQAVSDGSAANASFVEMVAAQTIRAQRSGSLLARRPEVDFLLRLAGTSQISKAIRENGAVDGKPFLLVVAGTERPKAMKGVECEELPRRALSAEELRRIEAAALLDAQRA